MKVLVTSSNPVKINAAREAFQKMLPVEDLDIVSFAVSSDVSDQPMSDAETFTGAWNRVENVAQQVPDADFWVGIEGGIERKNTDIEVFAWIVIKNRDGMVGKGRSATFFLPPAVIEKINDGMELGKASDAVFNETNSKQGLGTVGLLTNGLIDRTRYYVEPAIMALIPFANSSLYSNSNESGVS